MSRADPLPQSSPLPLPLPQSPEFARACDALDVPVRCCRSAARGDPRLHWQIQSRRFGRLGRVDLISRGPVALHTQDLQGWLSRWHHWQDRSPLILNAEGLAAADLRAAGFWPLVTPATIALLPLGASTQMRAGLRQKWRNRLNKAEHAGLTLRKTALSGDHWLLNAEAAQARRKRYRGMPPAFSAAFAARNPGQTLVIEALKDGAPVAGVLILCHGRMATWQIGHSSAEGRSCNAMNLLLWAAMTELADRGHDLLDLGILNAQDAPGLAHFKRGTGARAQRLSGTWLHMGLLAPLARWLPDRMAS